MTDANDTALEVDGKAKGQKLSRSEKLGMRARMRELLLMLPRLVRLLLRLVRDPRVSRADKVILGGTVLYVIMPLDFIPDMIPFIGQVDDAYLVAISVLRILNRADPSVIADHWDGEIDIKKLAGSIANVATFFLPSPIKNALSARIDIREPKPLRAVGSKQK